MAKAIVVGVDGSEEALAAARLGRRLARGSEAELHLVAVATGVLLDVMAARSGVDPGGLDRALVQHAFETARSKLSTEFESVELEGCLVAKMGRPEHVLAEYGREHLAGLFVLGAPHSPTPRAWLRQGMAHHLLRVADVPVVIARTDAAEIERVLVAVDQSAVAASVHEAGAALADTLGASLEAIHVIPDPPHLELVPGFDADRWARAAEKSAVEKFGPIVSRGTEITYLRGDVVSNVCQAAEGGPSTLLVVGGQGRGRVHRLLLGSTTEALIAQPPTSLAVIPTP